MPFLPVSGTQYQGGAAPTSGSTSGSYSGPWLIETQNLTLQYARVPYAMLPFVNVTASTISVEFDSDILSLSAVNTRKMEVGSTNLIYVITANYSRYKSYDAYPTSSAWAQPQKFGIVREADQFGVTYGSGTATNLLGPAGRIVTTQPYMRRILWDDTIHSEVNQTVTATNCIVYKLQGMGASVGGNMLDPTFGGWDFTKSIRSHYQNTFISDTQWQRTIFSGPLYVMMGKYAAANETDAAFASFLNDVGDNLENSSFAKINPVGGTDFGADWTGGLAFTPSIFAGLPSYRSNRHSYT